MPDDLTPREALLEAAARLLAEQGPEALTTRRLAAEIGASTMAVYTWYGGKPSLMRALFREGFARFGAHLRSVPPTGDGLGDLAALGRAYREFALANPCFYEIMFGRSSAAFAPEEEDRALALSTLTILVDAVARCTGEGLLAGEPAAVALQIWAAVHGAVSLELTAGADVPLFAGGAVYDALVATVVAGLSAAPA